MPFEDAIHESILEDDYERYRAQAEKCRKRGESEQSAAYYRQSADVLEQLADIEGNNRLAQKRRDLAKNLRSAATKLERDGSLSSDDRSSTASDDAGDTSGGAGTGAGAEDGAGSPGQVHRRGKGADDEVDPTAYLEAPPDVDFDDVGGMVELKETLKDRVIDPLERPELYEEYDLGVVNGILLYGPPGTGKTYITRALAGKLGYNFIEVTPADITSSLVGEAADNVAELFEVARDNQPCLVFVDEIDAIAGQRSGGAQKTQSERQMVNQLLQELTEIQGEDVVVVGATNIVEEVDDAIKRSGRFDERIEVPLPDGTARVAILRVHLRDRPALPDEIDWETVERLTEGYSASDMELVAKNAARKALMEAREQGDIQYITQEHVEQAIEETEPSLPG